MIQVGQLPRHDVTLVDEGLSPIATAHPTVTSPLRLVLDKERRPVHWFDPDKRVTLPIVQPLQALNTLRFAYSALLDAPGACWCTWTAMVNIRAPFLMPCSSMCWMATWKFAAMIDWQWMVDNKILIGELLWQHTQLVCISLFLARC